MFSSVTYIFLDNYKAETEEGGGYSKSLKEEESSRVINGLGTCVIIAGSTKGTVVL